MILGVLEGLINRGLFRFSIFTPSLVQCIVHDMDSCSYCGQMSITWYRQQWQLSLQCRQCLLEISFLMMSSVPKREYKYSLKHNILTQNYRKRFMHSRGQTQSEKNLPLHFFLLLDPAIEANTCDQQPSMWWQSQTIETGRTGQWPPACDPDMPPEQEENS